MSNVETLEDYKNSPLVFVAQQLEMCQDEFLINLHYLGIFTRDKIKECSDEKLRAELIQLLSRIEKSTEYYDKKFKDEINEINESNKRFLTFKLIK